VPRQEAGQRPARPLPYDIRVSGKPAGPAHFALEIENAGAGVALSVHAPQSGRGPWHYTLAAGTWLSDELPFDGATYAFDVYGPNGFLRTFRGKVDGAKLEASLGYDPATAALVLRIANRGKVAATVIATANDYAAGSPHIIDIAAGSESDDRWDIASSAHWYDLSLKTSGDCEWLQRFAGHIETGSPSLSDPAFGRQSA